MPRAGDVCGPNLSLLNTFASDFDALGGHANGSPKPEAGIDVPRELAAPVVSGDRYFVAAVGTDEDPERFGNAAVDSDLLELVVQSLGIDDLHLDGDGVGAVVPNGEVEAAVLLAAERPGTPCHGNHRPESEELTPTHEHPWAKAEVNSRVDRSSRRSIRIAGAESAETGF